MSLLIFSHLILIVVFPGVHYIDSEFSKESGKGWAKRGTMVWNADCETAGGR